jgi:hypothetical protein
MYGQEHCLVLSGRYNYYISAAFGAAVVIAAALK